MTEGKHLFASGHFLRTTTFAGGRYGKTWEDWELGQLYHLFNSGEDLEAICVRLQRPAAGVIAKLSKELDRNVITNDYYRRSPVTESVTKTDPTLFYTPIEWAMAHKLTKEQDMTTNANTNAKNIETVTMIRGTDASQLSDDQIFSFIGKLEAEAEALSKIQAKPKKLGAKIEAIHADIKALVEYVDGR